MKYDYVSMRKGSNDLKDCLDKFVEDFKNIATQIEWDGKEKEMFESKCDEALGLIKSMGLDLAKYPVDTADRMMEEDYDYSNCVRGLCRE